MGETTSTTRGAVLEETTPVELDRVIAAAEKAAESFGASTHKERACYLEAIADELDRASGELVPLAEEESHLPTVRLGSELRRTTGQLRLMGEAIGDGRYLEATIDHAEPEWFSGPRPDLRRMLRPIGPVAVFGASNFPFAFSVIGGDSASALAAGCPVVHKANPAHLRLASLTAEVVRRALFRQGLEEGVFSLIAGDDAGSRAVTDDRVKAVGFTGSTRVGRMLFDLAASRPRPIPFYGELGSLNPVFVTKKAAAERRDEILTGYVGSFTLGSGQFCTKPGFLVLPADSGAVEALAGLVGELAPSPMLNERIEGHFLEAVGSLAAHSLVDAVVQPSSTPRGPKPGIFHVAAGDLMADFDELHKECFGPCSVVVTYEDEAQLLALARLFDGELTATIHCSSDEAVTERLAGVLAERVGRLIMNGWPTGVAVSWAMNHGGPYPATTAGGFTSVGTEAIRRFLRPVTYQGVAEGLLPKELQEENPLGIVRRVDGRIEEPAR